MGNIQKVELITIGVSHGGLEALTEIFSRLSPNFKIPVIVIYHRSVDSDWNFLNEYFSRHTLSKIFEVSDSDKIEPGCIYFATGGYHLLLENKDTMILNLDDRINYSRPSIDIFFDSASQTYTDKLMGILLTGANTDGAEGLCKIARAGGYTVVQDPAEAISPVMPQAAINICGAELDAVASLKNISEIMNNADTFHRIKK